MRNGALVYADGDSVSTLVDALKLRGTVTLSTYEMQPEWEGMELPEIATLLVGQNPVSRQTEHNILCNIGLNQLAAAILWAGIVDQNANMGSTFVYTDLTPMYGAIGTGDVTTVPPSANDTQLVAEIPTLGRSVVVTAGATAGFSTFNPSVTWQFLLPINVAGAVLTECGIFVNASSLINSGALLNHAAITVTQSSTQLVSLTVTITVGN